MTPNPAKPAMRETPIYRSVGEIAAGFGPCVAAIGNFDGVHLGHCEILSSVVEEARGLGVRSIAITFDPHPAQFLRPDRAPALLTPMDERIALLTSTGIDGVLVLPFDAALAAMPAEEFVREILVSALGVRALHEGGNFRFGHGARAGVSELKAFGAGLGFAVHVHKSVSVRGLEVSSSAIRVLVAAGDVRRARWMLGRPFGVRSTQARGRGVGTKLLVPTVNLAPYAGLLPGFGVYVTRLTIQTPDGGRCFQAVTNVGNRPTFEGVGFGVETHILDFEPVDIHPTDEDLSAGAPVEIDEETPLKLEFLMRLRGEMKWPSTEALKAQIFKDVARAKRFFRLAK